MEQETSTLILSTFDISTSIAGTVFYNKTVDNQIGTISNNRCTLTWKNINMRQVLGEMYDTYETFNVYFVSNLSNSLDCNCNECDIFNS